MNPLLQSWLEELRAGGLRLSGEARADANENLWPMALPSSERIDGPDLVAFLYAALDVRRELASSHPAPVTFYAWHDEMAGQLRLSTVCSPRDALPFNAPLLLVEHPIAIVNEFLGSHYRDGIPLDELEVIDPRQLGELPEPDSRQLRVWAIALR